MYFLLYCLLCLSAFFLVLVRSPVFSSFFLILLFCIGSFLIFILGVIDYIALLYIIVYVGAVAVLFLFVIMMIDVRVLEERYSSVAILPLLFFFVFLLFLHIYMYLYFYDNFLWYSNIKLFLNYYFYIALDYNNLQHLSAVFFSLYSLCFIICGFLLLSGMIGAISIALTERGFVKQQILYHQVMRINSINLYRS